MKKVRQPKIRSMEAANNEPGNDRAIQPRMGTGTDTVLKEQVDRPFGKTLKSPKK
jgi:hypothetical protein